LDVASPSADTINETLTYLKTLQRNIDVAVNNSANSRKLNVPILATPGSLIFGIPRLAVKRLGQLKSIIFVYLIDEIENISEDQQRYLQTLIREKSLPCSFKIGARLNGIKTYKTYSSEEENKEGSEFETIFLDDELRNNRNYFTFARNLVLRRIMDAGLVKPTSTTEAEVLDQYMESPETDEFEDADLTWIIKKYQTRERPYMQSLRRKLIEGLKTNESPGIHSSEDIDIVIKLLSFNHHPLLEKVNVFMLYQSWARGGDLRLSAKAINKQCKEFIRERNTKSKYKTVWDHFKTDLLAQLLRDCDSKQNYFGITTFIAMSQGFPRNLLNILKHIYNASIFNGEQPFVKSNISITSQREGVKAASNWFFDDARSTGDEGTNARDAVSRLAELFREIRFSDKPSECSLVTFSCPEKSISKEARRTLLLAEKVSLLIKIRGGQRDRNTARVDSKYQLNAMLSPRWDLPIWRRGAIGLSAEETNAIFDREYSKDFPLVARRRVERMTAPHFGKSKRSPHEPAQLQKALPF
jgi:hypothetical protein